MAEFKTLDVAAFTEAGERGAAAASSPRALSARFDRRTGRLTVKLDTGLDFSFHPSVARDLAAARPEDLAVVKVEGAGGTLSFPRLDVDVTVSRLLETFLGPLEWARRDDRVMSGEARSRRAVAG